MSGWIVAMGDGGFSMEPDNPLLDLHVLQLAHRRSPRVCFVATASGDSEGYRLRFHRAFSALGCRTTDLTLFARELVDLRAFVLEQDVIYVGAAAPRTCSRCGVHGLDVVLRDAWQQGIVLCSVSAGMNCWFEACLTDSFAVSRLDALTEGLGMLQGSACPHYDGEPERRPTYHRLIAQGALPSGLAADDGAALVFAGTKLHEVVASRPDAAAYRVTAANGHVVEEQLRARYLGERIDQKP